MKRGLMASGVVAVLAAAGLSLGLAASADATTSHAAGDTATATGQASPRYVALDCTFKPVVRPGTYELACADDGLGITGMHWTTWTQHFASGYGTSWEKLCVPNCASGKIGSYPVVAVLTGSATVKGYPADRRYTEVTLIYTGKRPPYYEVVNHKVVTTYPPTLTVPAL